jgi:hypothetical protein
MKFKKALQILWMIAIVAMAALHFLHLRADFPNFTRWSDWSKYTDEGWYGNAAIQYYIRGSWYVPGDINTAPAVPVWPFFEWILFYFTGVTVQAARALAVSIFCCNVALSYLLIRKQEQRWVALLGTSLIVTSSFLYCFSRLAILEPLLICFALSALMVASWIAQPSTTMRRVLLSGLLGLLCCLMILTKTTGLFLTPAIAYYLWYPQRKAPAAFLRSFAIAAATAGSLWMVYYGLLVHTGYVRDFHVFFPAGVHSKHSPSLGAVATFFNSMHGSLWIDRTVALLTLALMALSSVFARSLWRNPLFVSSAIAIGGYFFFIGFHNNMQPRYYAVVAFFLFLMASLATAAMLRANRALGGIALAIVVLSLAVNATETIRFARHPEYTFVNAARDLTAYMDAHPNGNRMLLATSGSDISLITGMHAICDEFGTDNLRSRLSMYQPGYFAAWNDLDPAVLSDIHSRYWLEQVAEFHAFDDPQRNLLVLFKLHPQPANNAPVADQISVPIQ